MNKTPKITPVSISELFPKENYRVRIRHYRNQIECENAGFPKKAKWATWIRVYDAENPDVLLATADSACSKRDTPCRKTGLYIALQRAAKMLKLSGFPVGKEI